MSYQVLARKWRPSNFSEVAGQGHVLQSLINALDNQRLHHAYLFTGTRGVGKTTLARILAKCLNCEEGIGSRPCGKCDSCLEINQGRFVDLIEVDAASRTKVEDTRDLLENVQYTPTRGRFKVYLIDEVHMLSNHSFNALLKTLEEPPPHVKFLFATTDPQKLPVTILSRCLQFNLKNLSPEIIVSHLQSVLNSEKVEYEEPALWQIAQAASGSMRDALTLADQAIAYCEGTIRTNGVVEMLGVPEQRQVIAILEAMAAMDAEKLLALLGSMAEQAPDYVQTLDSLLSALHRIALAQVSEAALDNSFGDREQIKALAGQFIAEDVQLFYQIGNKGRDELRITTDLRATFEMLMLRMLIFSPNYLEPDSRQPTAVEALPEASGEAAVKKKSELTPPRTTPDTEARRQSPPPKVSPAVQVSVSEQERRTPDAGRDTETPQAQRQISPTELADLDQQRWLELFPEMEVSGMTANVLANTVVRRVDNGTVSLLLDASQSAVYSEELLPKLSDAFSQHFGQAVRLEVEIAELTEETPARLARRLRDEQHQQMVSEFEQDENVQQMLKRFSGRIAPESISVVENEEVK